MYAVYDMKQSEQCVGVFKRIKEVAKYFNTTENAIRSTICKGYKKKHRYLIVKINL